MPGSERRAAHPYAMTLKTWWLFVGMTFVVSATPGPNMLLVLGSSARHGFRAAIATVAGCLLTLLVMMGISAAGVGAVLQAFPAVFDTLRWTGAAYLACLGVRTWRAPVAASNPKAILFCAAFLPQVIDPAVPALPKFIALVATFAVIEVGWYCVYAAGGRHLAVHLRRAAVRRAFNRATGGAFVGFAFLIAASRR